MKSLLCRTAIVATCMTALVAFQVESHAAILSSLGNLGAAGSNPDDPTTNFLVGASGANDSELAIKFTPVSPNLQLQYAQMYFGAPTGSAVASVAVVTDASGSPSSTVVASFSDTSISAESKYTFSTSALLTAGTPYWLVVSQTTPGAAFSWFAAGDGTDPVAQNGSGWSYGATKRSLNGGSTWSNYAAGTSASVSLSAAPVPEPSTYAVALAGLACGGYSMFRRRRTRCLSPSRHS